MTVRSIEDIYPLSPTQRGMLSHLLSEPGSRAYFEQFHCELRGDLDGDAFAAAWKSVVDRQPVLRTAFDWEEADEPLQVVLHEAPLPLVRLDWSALSPEESDRRLREHLRQDRERGFALAEPPLMRLALIRLAPDRCRFVWSHHHLLLDGWCRPLLFQEVLTFYEAARRGRPPRLDPVRPFRDYIAWLQQQDAAAAEAFWRGQLRGYRGAPLVPDETPRQGGGEQRGEDHERARLPAGLSRQLELCARLHGVTLNTLTQAAWALLFSRYGGEDDLAFGIVVSGRPPELDGVESMVGLFINSLPLRVKIAWDRPLAAWLPELQQQSLEILHHGHVFLGDIRRWGELPSGRRLFDSLLAFQNFPIDRGLDDRIGLEVRDSRTFELSEFPLSLVIEPGPAIGLWLGFDPRFVGRATAARMLRQYEALLQGMASAPGGRLRDFGVLTAGERWQLVGEWNDTGEAPASRLPVHALIAERACLAGEAAAVLAGGRRVSYRELLALAGRIALALRAARLGPGAIVAILMQRSPEHLAALLGVLQAGGAFLPLDPAYPQERLRTLLEDSRAAALLTTRAAEWEHLAAPGRRLIDLDELTAGAAGELDEPPAGAAGARGEPPMGTPPSAQDGSAGLEDLAYVFYTSGSTGSPKGVAVGHRAFAGFALEMAESLDLGPGDRMLQFASPAFDVLLEEVFPVWLRGGAVVLESPQTLSSPLGMAAAMREQGVTIAELPAAYWHAWVSELEESGARPAPSLRLLLVGAEKPAVHRLAAWQRHGIPLIYVFGLTETAVTSSFHRLALDRPATGELPIGRPLRGARYHVADAAGGVAPLGTTGELYIGGAGLAIGYLGRPDATAERFVPDPFGGEPGGRLYRTGDLVRHRPDGNLDFLGRCDAQVKVRGFRIELGEIEAALRRHPAVADAAVAVQEQAPGELRLVGYVCPGPGWSAAGLAGAAAANAGALLRERRLELWPSHGEYPIYDPAIYHRMGQDEERNRRYRQAIRKRVPGKVVLDVGTGGEAILARLCVEAGAARVYAIESSPAACEAARAMVARLGLSERIRVILGEATAVELPERVEVCVSELIGTIGGSEGAAAILNQVRRRWLAPGGEMVPRRCLTRIAAVEIPDGLRERPRFGQVAAHYAAKVLEQIGDDGDLRVCVRHLPAARLLSERGIFEELDFAGELPESWERDVRLRVSRAGRLDGFLVWIELEPEAGDALSALDHECSWLPLLFPIFAHGEAVAPGDRIEARAGGAPVDDGIHPDYWIAGALRRESGGEVEFSYRSPYRQALGPGAWFGRRLLAGYRRGELEPEGETIAPQSLRSHLSKVLPDYMVPATWMAIPALPLTPNGKVDRRALPAPGGLPATPLRQADPPRDAVEECLAGIWKEVLGIETVGIHDNFFELGGDSILSIQVAARARRHRIELAPWQLFEEDTIAKLAVLVAGQRAAKAAPPGPAAGGGPPVLTPIQRWFFAQELPQPWHWNMSVLLTPGERLSPDLLRRGLGEVVARHEALAYRFVRAGGAWRPELAAARRRPALPRIDLSRLPEDAWVRVLEDASGRIQRGFDLGRAPLLAAAWFEVPAGARLLLAAHHLVVDALSWRILVEELETAYGQLLRGEAVDLPAEPIGFAAWSRRLAELARSGALGAEVDYWLAAPRLEAGRLPIDLPEGRNLESSAQSVRVTLPAATAAGSTRTGPLDPGGSGAAAGAGSHLQDLLLTALVLAARRWTGHDALLVDLEGHGREGLFPGVDPSRTVGWFATVYPVLLEAPAEDDPAAALEAVRRQLRAVPGRGIGYGVLRWLGNAEVGAALAGLPAAEVAFNYLGQIAGSPRAGGLFRLAKERIGPGASPAGRRDHLLEINAWMGDGGLEVEWTFSAEVHRRATVERLAAEHLGELRALLAQRAAPGLRGRGPADFPLAALDQAAFDRLAGALAGGGEVEDVYLQSPLQQGMLFHGLLTPGAGMYVAQLVCELPGDLDVAAMIAAWQRIVDRHPALRAAFFWQELDRPVQVVFRQVRLPWTEIDLAPLPAAAREGCFATWLRADRRRGFDAAVAPLLRLCLCRWSPRQCRLVLTFHQMLLDGWSLPLVLADVLTAYEAELRGGRAELPARRPYQDYVEWWLRQDAAEAESYWRRALAGAQPTPLPQDGAPARRRAADYAEERLRVPAPALAELQGYARRNRLTLASLAQAAWGLILGRWSAAPEAVVGIVVSGRPAALEGIESSIGLFVNTLPLRVPLDGARPVAEWLHEVQRRQTEMRRYQHSPLAEVQSWAGMTPSQPLFESILVFQNYPVEATLAGRWEAIGIGAARTHEQTHYGLTLVVEPARELQLTISYPGHSFRRSTVVRLLGHLQAVLEDLPRTRETAGLGGLSGPERHQVLVEWNDAPWSGGNGRGDGAQVGDGDRDGDGVPVVELFLRHARIHPQRVAARFERAELTCGGLLAASGRLAARLRQLGIGPETGVAVFLERSLAPLIALVAVFRAGGVFIPLDPAQPRERVALLLAEAAAAVVVTQSSLLPELPALEVPVLCIDRDDCIDDGEGPEGSASGEGVEESASGAAAVAPPPALASPGHLAYVIFTSGSTGRPKAVAVEQRQLAHYVRAVMERLALPPGASYATVSSFATDLGHTAIFPALAGGGCLHILAESRISDPEAMAEYFERHAVDCLKIVPSHLAILLGGKDPRAVLPRRCLVLGGEAADPGLIAQLRALAPDLDVHNHYGPTETTVGVSTWRLPAAAAGGRPPGRGAASVMPIGRPLSGLGMHLLGDGLVPLPIGAAGEVYIGGRGVARCYLGQPAATAERFLPDPWGEPGARLYRTGDLARRLADGSVEFLGRIDSQVKVRGHRIEIAEVEDALRAVAGVREAAVALTGETAAERGLCGWVVRLDGAPVSPGDLRLALRQRLPDYMVPTRWMFPEALARLPSGKLDRRALVGMGEGIPGAGGPEHSYVAPRNPLEQRVAEIWAAVLRVPRVGADDDFFARLGGHSLLATQAVSRIRRELRVDLPLRGIFDQPTVAGLAALIAEQLAGEAAGDEIERLLDELEEPPPVSGSIGTGGAFS